MWWRVITPYVLPDISPLEGGDWQAEPSLGFSLASRNVDRHTGDSIIPDLPPEGEMAGKPEGGILAPRPPAAICFYRALVQTGETAPVAALVEALEAEGLNALPVFVSSLKDAVCG